MRELNLLNIISNELSDSKYLGDDCAYIDDLGICVTQDTLVQDVHFSLDTTTPYLLGRKTVSVNLSDLAAALAKPKYITVSLSLPKSIEDKFVSELYQGINDVCNEFNVKVIGGDITGSDKVVISICAIGKKDCLFISSRKNAKNGDYVVTTGNYGASACALYGFKNFFVVDDVLKQSHLNPMAKVNEALSISNIIDSDIAGMDTSDGLIDALYKISIASNHTIEVDFDNIPIKQEVLDFCKANNIDYKNFVLWGGEDFELIFTVNSSVYSKLDKNIFKCIGRVLNKDNSPSVYIKYSDKKEKITKEIFENNAYNHF